MNEPIGFAKLGRKKTFKDVSLVSLQLMEWLKICHGLRENILKWRMTQMIKQIIQFDQVIPGFPATSAKHNMSHGYLLQLPSSHPT